jgi:hypothetical protein
MSAGTALADDWLCMTVVWKLAWCVCVVQQPFPCPFQPLAGSEGALHCCAGNEPAQLLVSSCPKGFVLETQALSFVSMSELDADGIVH